MKMKTSYEVKVVSCELENEGSQIYRIVLDLGKNSGFEAEPGQFVGLCPSESGTSVMPRPFSIADLEGDIVTLIINVVGKNTAYFVSRKTGDHLTLMGPEGKAVPYNIDGCDYLYVGGGIGTVALMYLGKKMCEENIYFGTILGAKTEEQLIGVEHFNKYGYFVNTIVDSNNERGGFVTDLLYDEINNNFEGDPVIACGPKAMLRKVARLCREYGNNCTVILEEIMACGMGSCKGCAVPMIDGTVKHVCSDGPAFDAEKINWDEFMREPVIEVIERKPIPTDAMRVDFCGLELEYPTMNASGCLAVQTLLEGKYDYSKLGALVTKGVTVLEKKGNKMPRTCETSSGMINSIGLENIGIDRFVPEELPLWLSLGKPVFVNISGNSIDDYVKLARAINKTDAVGVEVNISCPNDEGGGIAFGQKAKMAFAVVAAVRQSTSKIVMVKLTPNVTDIVEIARAVVDAGADAVSLVNTFSGNGA
jgi:NAD(P)H-flavin reductase